MHELHTTYVRNSSLSRNSRRHVYFLSLSLSVSLPIFLYFIYIYIYYSYTIYILSILFKFSSPFFLCNFVCFTQSTVVKCLISREAHVINVKNGLTKPKRNRCKKKSTERKIEQTIKKDRKEIGQEKKIQLPWNVTMKLMM